MDFLSSLPQILTKTSPYPAQDILLVSFNWPWLWVTSTLWLVTSAPLYAFTLLKVPRMAFSN